MRIKAIIIYAVLLLFITGSLQAIELDSLYWVKVDRGMELSYQEKYSEAKIVFRSLIENDSDDYLAYLFLAGVYYTEMLDFEDFDNGDLFLAYVDTIISKAEKDIKNKKNLAWAHLAIGNSHGYIAAFEGKSGSWWRAMKRGLKAKSHFLKTLKADSTLYDAYLGMGTYHYWKSAKTEFINWLPFVKDRKEEGIAELQLAINNSRFSSYMAQNSLAWVFIHQMRFAEAIKITEKLQRKYPGSRMSLWALAYANYYAGNLRKAIMCFDKLIENINDLSSSNYYNLIECRYNRALCYRKLGKFRQALEELDTLLAYPLSDEIMKRQEKRLKSAKKIRKKLSEKLADEIEEI